MSALSRQGLRSVLGRELTAGDLLLGALGALGILAWVWVFLLGIMGQAGAPGPLCELPCPREVTGGTR